MIFLIKFAVYFTISFLILNFPVADKKIFNHIEVLTDPVANKFYKKIGSRSKDILDEGKKVTKKMFNNTSKKDVIRTGQSSSFKKSNSLPKDDYTPEERDALLKILNQEE